MQPRKSCSAVGSSACWTGCFPLPPALDAPLSPCPLTPAKQLILKNEIKSDAIQLLLSDHCVHVQYVCVLCICSHHGVSGCESGPVARVCLPRWIEGPAARVESTPSLAGSEEQKGQQQRYAIIPQ